MVLTAPKNVEEVEVLQSRRETEVRIIHEFILGITCNNHTYNNILIAYLPILGPDLSANGGIYSATIII